MYYFAVEECMMGCWSKLAEAAGTGKKIRILGSSPCKTSKVAILRNNLVGMLTMKSRGWINRKISRLVIMH